MEHKHVQGGGAGRHGMHEPGMFFPVVHQREELSQRRWCEGEKGK